jgi:predicted dehydrogenase/threonine dehydrogenase-like Zn-dependent dehydrogenase
LRQVLIKDGSVFVAEVPAPEVGARNVLVRVVCSCISAGTEMASVRNSGIPLYRRALRQPQNVRRVLEIVREQGVQYALDRVRGKLASGSPTGYSAAGLVIAVGKDVEGFAVGDRVACAGAGVANHAEIIDVPVNLAVRLPNGLSFEDAATVTLGAIALQGVRRAQPTLGETIVVAGLGLLGLLTVQLLRAHGCRVIGVDPAPRRRELALEFGANALDPAGSAQVEQIIRMTDGAGADAVIITAAGAGDEIISEAFRSCRRKGRVVIVGDVGLNLVRADFYAKEIDVLISASYGPGRYDPWYEEGGQDYPLAYVRWTENRNMAAYLELLGRGGVRLAPLGPRAFPLTEAAAAYASLGSGGGLLSLLTYPHAESAPERTLRLSRAATGRGDRVRVALIGAGGFAQGMHLPNLQRLRAQFDLRAVISRTGTNARAVAQQYGAAYAGTDYLTTLSDPDIDLVIIATRHHMHGRMVLAALQAGKHVLVEKPLAIEPAELDAIAAFFAAKPVRAPVLMTGFNRRFSPAMRRARQALAQRSSPMIINYRMNAGHLPATHWVHGPEGGGRNIGEACHIYDLFQFLTAASWTAVQVTAVAATSRHFRSDDNFVAAARYDDGSVCTLTYTALGAKQYPKERMELFCDGMVVAMDDYRSLEIAGGSTASWSAKAARKGQYEELEALAGCLREGGDWPISLADQLAASRLAFAVQQGLVAGGNVAIAGLGTAVGVS